MSDILKITVEGLGELIASAVARATRVEVDKSVEAPAETKPAKSAKAAAATEPPATKPAAPAITLEQFRAKLSAFGASDDNRALIVAAIAKHGAAKVGEVPAEKYADVLAELGL